MSRVCNICGKGQASGNNVSHSNRKTRRTFKVNVQKISYVEDGKEMNGYVCARCIRTLKKRTLNNFRFYLNVLKSRLLYRSRLFAFVIN